MLISSLGGHLEQLLSLKDIIEKYDVHIVTEKNSSTSKLHHKYSNISFIPYVSRKNFLFFIFTYVKIIFHSIKLLLKENPKIIVSTGSGCALPMCFLGKIMRKKIIFIETFSRINSKTLTGKLCYRFADVFVIQWEELKILYPKAVYLGSIY
ncbi:PssD/Cps14F family polysaccharide biosynthesis glycosyltransferase [Maribacter sp. 2210JD10-5]|uniref:PssD/Cps14F family polysaccharide biosynthesis glycosyltransferase n=1 Tax=Maribacter sp. 2210JD10-5 TaxID=3386272 RepID=UPI0039BC9F48